MFGQTENLPEKIIDTLTYLNKYFVPVHVHGNNACSAEGKPWLIENMIPMCMEVTYIRKDLITSYVLDTQTYPIEGLDKNNNHILPDMKLNWSSC